MREVAGVKRFCSMLFAIGFVVATSATAVPAEDQQVDAQAQQLLQKHRDYVGWQFGDGTFRTLRIAGTVTNKKGEKLRELTSSYAGVAFQQTRTLLKQGGIKFH